MSHHASPSPASADQSSGPRKLRDLDVAGKRVLCRVDFNVPMEHGRIADLTRVARVLPTIEYLIERKAKIVLLSHLGRPDGAFVREFSLAPLADALSQLLNGKARVAFAVDCVGHNAEEAVSAMQPGDVLLLENLRFHAGEEGNDPAFADALAALGDVYVNESFSCSHRAHASIVGAASRLPSACGFLMEEEIERLEHFLSAPEAPLAAVIGGSKISTKLGLLHSLVKRADFIAVGGAMANTFLKAKGLEVGASLCEPDRVGQALQILKEAEEHGCEIVLPVDAVVCATLSGGERCGVCAVEDVPPAMMMLDIGPRSAMRIAAVLEQARTLLWNGPLGAFEHKPFDNGTVSVARHAALLTSQGKLVSVAGGGDVIAGLKKAGLVDSMSYVSTAGGAFLEWLENPMLPGIAAL
jgi:phosphoglycerate kinase